MAEQYKHIFIAGTVTAEKYKQSRKRGTHPTIPIRDRAAHSRKLLQQFEQIWNEKANRQAERTAKRIATREGTYLSFTSGLDADLITKILESIKSGIRLLNIKEEIADETKKQ